jgi:vancomycin resistance protein YoaR
VTVRRRRFFWSAPWVLPVLVPLGIAAALPVALLRWWPLVLPGAEGATLPGLRVDGEALPPGVPVRSWLEAHARALRERRVRLIAKEGDSARAMGEWPMAALGVSVDVEEALSRLLRVGRSEDWLERARLADCARRGELRVSLEPRVDGRVTAELLMPLKEDLDRPPVSARVDVEHHAIIAGEPGRALDVDATIAAIARAAKDPTVGQLEISFASVRPHVTTSSLAAIDTSHVVSAFATYFSRRGDQAARAQNIETAASHLDGLVMEPGDLVSFNDVVGARSEDNGFQKAFEIFKGEMVEGMGGGTCQVASTLHATAFFGGLDIVQRLPHSRPSAYIPVGLDATVVYPVVDLKLRNPYSFPVVVHATVGPNRIAMQLLGAAKPVRVALMRTVLATTPFERQVEEDPATAKPRRKQKGQEGIKLLRKRLIAFRGGGPSRIETSHDTYPPTAEIWKVPPGYDESELPPLGEDLPAPDDAPPASPPPPRPDPEQTIWSG